MTEGTIIKGVGGQYTVDTPEGQYICNARGLFRKQNLTPVIGDRVQIRVAAGRPAGDFTGMLMAILPRTNELRRPRVANVDQVVIVLAAAQPDLHFTILDRYLIQAEYEEIAAAICVNKTDLGEDIPHKVRDIYEPAGYPVFIVSVNSNIGLEDFKNYLQAKTTVLAGPSGVGKSSIINCITGEASMATGKVSERIGRGKHTTRHAEFVPIKLGTDPSPSGYIIDTPGFSSLEPPDIPLLERAELFKEFRPWLGKCRFNNCLHRSEQDCAIKEQIGISIAPSRYERYIEWISD